MDNLLFGIPFYKNRIDPSLYDKDQIVSVIRQNYDKDKYRNHWQENVFNKSNMHHAYNDWNNEKFIKINFDRVLPLYQFHISEFLNTFQIVGDYQYQFQIVNYTCYGSNQYMREHDHSEFDFSAIHYLRYDEKYHSPTLFCNPIVWNNYSETLISEKLHKGKDNLYNSWLKNNYYIGCDEDDFIIFPGLLRHYVPESNSEELRIAVVVNIKVI